MFTAVLILVIAGALYFLPTIVASNTKKANTSAIFLLNLLLGWTLVGWVVALVWAASSDRPAQQVIVQAPAPAPPPVVVQPAAPVVTPAQESALCAACGKFSHAGMKFCPHCGAAMAT